MSAWVGEWTRSFVLHFLPQTREEHTMVSVGMDVHGQTTTSCLYDPDAEPSRQHRSVTRPTTASAMQAVLGPLGGRCRVACEVGTQAQWVAGIVRPLAIDVQVANPSRIPWLFRFDDFCGEDRWKRVKGTG